MVRGDPVDSQPGFWGGSCIRFMPGTSQKGGPKNSNGNLLIAAQDGVVKTKDPNSIHFLVK
jgi:hypothetical protein